MPRRARASRNHARDAANPIEHHFVELKNLVIGSIARPGQRDIQRHQMIRLETEMDAKEAMEALAQQPGAHEQDRGGGKFHYDQLGAEAPPAATRGSASRFRQTRSYPRTPEMQRGCKGEKHAGGEGDARGES